MFTEYHVKEALQSVNRRQYNPLTVRVENASNFNKFVFSRFVSIDTRIILLLMQYNDNFYLSVVRPRRCLKTTCCNTTELLTACKCLARIIGVLIKIFLSHYFCFESIILQSQCITFPCNESGSITIFSIFLQILHLYCTKAYS